MAAASSTGNPRAVDSGLGTGRDRDVGFGPDGALATGQVVDGFRLLELLHQGGMATVWSAARVNHHGDTSLPLVMKVPRIKGGEDPATIVGFEVEQMIMPMLEGPHVPRFVARGDFTRSPYIVMERIEGPSLKPRLDHVPLPLDEVVEIGSRVATALHDLHRQHLVHLDVKPSNVMIRPDGTAALVDFGLSRHDHLPDLLDEEFTLPMGTGPYMSPEQVQFVRNDPRSDLFALGVMLYHFATGERPFGAPDTVRGLKRRLYLDPVPPRTLRPEIPPWLQEVILKCLEVKPERRYQSAALLALELQNPSQVALTRRAERLQRSGALRNFKRWFFSLGAEPAHDRQGAGPQIERNPIVMAAVDVDGARAELLDKQAEAVRRILVNEPGARLACVSVMRTARIGVDELVDDQGRSVHVKQLVALKHWARPIARAQGLEGGRLTFHVLEAPDAATALVEFARRNHVDQIVMGARGNSALRRYLGSVSSQVVAQSECSVTVVRVAPGGPARANDPQADAGAPPRPGPAPQPTDAAAAAAPPTGHIESRKAWDPSRGRR
jgi:nucleotide-binding universal stress UspA family protein